MKKKILIIVGAIFSFFVLGLIGLVVFYNISLEPVGTKGEGTKYKEITFIVENGMSSKGVIDSLYKNGLIKNKYVGYVFIKLNSDFMLQAGVYELNTGMDIKEIIEIIDSGKVVDNSISVTFIEGKRLTNYVNVISQKFGYSEDEILSIMSDKEYLNELIDKYWFLTEDILNDKLYYALEGYLAPNTYFFDQNASIENIIERLLDGTGTVLKEHKDAIDKSDYSIHEMITMASIVELEGASSNDRKGVAGVFYNRLTGGMSLGSDVTTYYGAKVEMSERDLYIEEINELNGYNTRPVEMIGKLPIGPICSPSKNALVAALEPESHDYYFFVADKNLKTHFTKTNSEHEAKIAELKAQGLWYVYK